MRTVINVKRPLQQYWEHGNEYFELKFDENGKVNVSYSPVELCIGGTDLIKLEFGMGIDVLTEKDDPINVGDIFATAGNYVCIVSWIKKLPGRSKYKILGISVKNKKELEKE